jgi:hypothetical protein
MPPPASPHNGASTSASSHRRNFYICCGTRFTIDSQTVLDALLHCVTATVEKFVLVLGPLLIGFASVLIGGLAWTFFTIILPMMQHKWKDSPYQLTILGGHVLIVIFLLTEICFNYFMCVTTRNKGRHYETLVRELASATHFDFPETPQAVESFRREFEDKMLLRMKRRQARASQDREQQRLQRDETNQTAANCTCTSESSTLDTPVLLADGAATASTGTTMSTTMSTTMNTTMSTSSAQNIVKRKTVVSSRKKQPFPRPNVQPTPTQIRSWMIMAPEEWGYCQKSKQPKPPRSHYDHVTKTLVLCLDHYCPWMFNAGKLLVL